MMRASVGPEGIVFDGELAEGTVAYVDADWVAANPAGCAIPALVIAPGELRFVVAGADAADAAPVALAEGLEHDAAAGAALAAVADGAAAVAAGASLAEVTGDGLIAAETRRLLAGTRAPGEDEQPEAIVDASGDPGAIAAACARVADLGTIVLAGEAAGRSAPFDLYTHVHGRGLRMIGVPRPLAGGVGPLEPRLPAPPGPGRATVGRPVARALWYRVDAAPR